MEVHHVNCIVGKSVQFLDNEWLRKIIVARYSDKVKNGILFITRTALCHFALEFGLGILDFNFKFIEVSSWLTVGKKALAALLATLPLPLLGLGGVSTIPVVILSVITFLSGTSFRFRLRESGLLVIKTQAIASSTSHTTQRIQDRTDVVIIDLEPSHDKMTMEKSSVPYECSLPDQMLGNPTCIRKTEINKISKSIKSGEVTVDTLIDYDEFVNMEDVTGLSDALKFNDQFETVPFENPGPIKSEHSRPNLRKNLRRTADLLEKYEDPKNVSDTETWDVEPYITQDKSRVSNNEL